MARSSARIEVIGVYGAGAWGLALAIAATRAGRRVVVVGRDGDSMAMLADARVSEKLPGVRLPPSIAVSAASSDLNRCDALLLATPAQAIRGALEALEPPARAKPLVVCAKGIERGTGAFLSDVVNAAAPGAPRACLSGPSFASDVAAGLPTAVTLAAEDEATAEALSDALHGPSLRLYASTDLRGVEIGGAAKNVLAIACGVADGLNLGASAKAALTARGFAELRRFASVHGARPETLMGLSGLGDLLLTCSSAQSRNFSFGVALGQGASVTEAGAGRLVEGAATAITLQSLARAKGVTMPIVDAVSAVLNGERRPSAAVEALLARPRGSEN